MDETEKLYLIDGSGFIFRAYYGLRQPMTAPDGTPTNAVYGFTRMILSLLKGRNPSHIAVVFDSHGPSFRADLYAAYKANRPEPPDDMKPQFGLCREVTRALGLPALEWPRYEADDLIGTLATRWTAQGKPCLIVTADKDMMQLVNPLVSIWDGKDKDISAEQVREKFGVDPALVVDWLALAGDSADNIPGVAGIGPKNASQLLQTYGSLEGILAHAHEIKGKRGQSLVENAEMARLCQKLAQIACDAPIDFAFEDMRYKPYENDTLYACFERLGFKQLIKEFDLKAPKPKAAEPMAEAVKEKTYRTVQSLDALEECLNCIREAGRLSLDLETTGLDPHRDQIVGFALSWAPGQAAYVPTGHAVLEPQLELDVVLEKLKPLLEDEAFPKMGQNIKFEYQMLRQAGIDYRGIQNDSMLAAYLLDPTMRRFNLDELSLHYLGHEMIAFETVTGSKGADAQFANVDLGRATEYACEDADIALQLCLLLEPKLLEAGLSKLLHEVELPLACLLGRMELWGLRLQSETLLAQSPVFLEQQKALEAKIYALAGEEFCIDSPKQLSQILFEKLGLKGGKKSSKTGLYSTDQSVLEKLAEENAIAALILEYRHCVKLQNTYITALPKLINPATGRVHTSFKQAVTATGRLASSDPNLQNIPVRSADGRAIRRAFVADEGFQLLSADYSQIELRLLAHFSQDPGLLSAFREGVDVHKRTAAQLFQIAEPEVTDEQRQRAKALGFGLMYGMSAFRLARELDIDRKEAKALFDRYFEQYASVKRFSDNMVEQAKQTHQTKTLFDRIRPLTDIDSRNYLLRQAAERLAVNTPIQGTAADIMKIAMLRVDERLTREGSGARMLLTVHDEIVMEVPEAELESVKKAVQEEMENAAQLDVPLKVTIGTGNSWADIH